jgi:protein-S-isoprenylcysteine O-methyltransferase Ste14
VATLPFLAFHVQATDIFSWSVVWLVVAPAFAIRLAVEWSRNGAISGGFPAALGRALLRPSRQKLAALAASARLWALKAIFIPLYAVSLVGLVRLALMADLSQPIGWLGLAVIFLYTIDLSFGLTGYLFASNELVPTVRSTQRSIVGWVVCLLCYGPIFAHWPAFEAVVHAEIGWTSQLVMTPAAIVGACALLALLLLYVWASVVFGMRFSNLSNRGVVTAGPYRLMKHPAYFAHATNSWIIALILMPSAGIDLGPTHWLVPIAFTFLYWARSRTEEQHMSEDLDYVAYSRWIARHGLVARLKRLIGVGERAPVSRSPEGVRRP